SSTNGPTAERDSACRKCDERGSRRKELMALHAVLSAVRQILLDFDTLPASAHARMSLYRERFKDLSTEEVEDLARIPSEKLAIYQETIFVGESNILRNH